MKLTEHKLCPGDGLEPHGAMAFSTWDMDNDRWTDGSCARDHQGAWWYNQCGSSSLNGVYLQSEEELQLRGLYWLPWAFPLRSCSLMLRPKQTF